MAQYLILQWPVGYGGGGKGGKITIGSKCLRFGGVCFGCGLGFTIYTHSGIQTDSGERLRKPSRKIGSNWHPWIVKVATYSLSLDIRETGVSYDRNPRVQDGLL